MGAESDGRRLPSGVPLGLLAAILLLAAMLRVAALDKPFYIDEMTTITVASQPLGEMARVMRLIDASPALFPLLLHAWIGLGQSNVWVRLLPALFGWAAVFVIWRIGRDGFGWRTGLAAAAVMAIAPAHVHYAQYVRSYSLFTLLAAVHVWLCLRWLDSTARSQDPPRRLFMALAATTAALLYTHYLSLLLFPVEALVVLGRWRSARRAVVGWGVALAVGGVLFLPGVPLLAHNMAYDRLRNLERPEPPPLVELVPTLVAEFGVGQRALGFDDPGLQRATLVAAVTVLPALALVGAARGWRVRRRDTLLLALVAVLPLVIYIGSGRRLVAVRFFLPFMVGYVVLIGHALATLSRSYRLAAAVAVLVLCVVPLAHFYRSYAWSYDHRRVAEAIRSRAAPEDVLFVVHPFESFYYRWYLGEAMPMRGLTFTALDEAEQAEYVIKPPPLDLARAQARIADAASDHPRFWVVGQSMRSFASDAAEEARLFDWLGSRYQRLDDLDALTGADPHVHLYAAVPPTGSGPP